MNHELKFSIPCISTSLLVETLQATSLQSREKWFYNNVRLGMINDQCHKH
jgi:hypothetical protein